MKQIFLFGLILVVMLMAACNATTPTPQPALPNPMPQQLPPPVTPAPAQNAPTATPTINADRRIAYNDIKEGAIDEPNAIDDWFFSADAGERVNIMLNSQFDGYLELYNPAGELIDSNDDSATNLNAALYEVQLTQTGTYRIVVRSYGGTLGRYELGLTGGHPTAGGGLLANGDSRNLMLTDKGYKWHYQGKQGEYLTVSVQAAPGLDSALALYGPDGALLTGDDDSGGNLNPELFEVPLPADGLYTIRANTVGSAGPITLTLTSGGQTSGGGELGLGQTQSGVLKPGRLHRWTFTGQADQIIDAGIASAEFAPYLELRNSQDAILTESDTGAITNFVLPAADTYTLVARSALPDAGGAYEISLKAVEFAPGGGPLTPDQPVQAALRPGQLVTYTFSAQTGEFITLKIQSEQLDSYLELYGPDGKLLLGDDDSGGGMNAAALDFAAPAAGEYQAVLKSARPEDDRGGVYSILLNLAKKLATAGALKSGQSETRQLKAGQQDTWTFTATKGKFVTAKMESDNLDTYLSLYNKDGKLLYVNDDFFAKQAAVANFIVPQTGDYRIVARSYSPDEAGSYIISLEITDKELPLVPTAPNQNN